MEIHVPLTFPFLGGDATGQVWFNKKTGDVFEQTRHKRMTQEKFEEGDWTLLFIKDHRFSPHGWDVESAWCERCKEYHCVYNSYDGNIPARDMRYISLLEKTGDCHIAELVKETGADRDTKYEDLLKLIDVLGINSDNVDSMKWVVRKVMELPRRKRLKLIDRGRDAILTWAVSNSL